MRLTVIKEEGIWRLSEIREFHFDFMRMAADDASLGDFPEGRKRLYPPPLAAKEAYQEEEFIGDWKEYVSSDLEMQFASDVGTFLSDLDEAQMTGTSEETGERLFLVNIPLDHASAWYSTFNHARLMLDQKHHIHPDDNLADEDLFRAAASWEENPSRIFVLMRYSLYEYLQDWMVTHVL